MIAVSSKSFPPRPPGARCCLQHGSPPSTPSDVEDPEGATVATVASADTVVHWEAMDVDFTIEKKLRLHELPNYAHNSEDPPTNMIDMSSKSFLLTLLVLAVVCSMAAAQFGFGRGGFGRGYTGYGGLGRGYGGGFGRGYGGYGREFGGYGRGLYG
ncbi:hypothetical protein MTO96_031642 [Rhipicephalus appendiculatus]